MALFGGPKHHSLPRFEESNRKWTSCRVIPRQNTMLVFGHKAIYHLGIQKFHEWCSASVLSCGSRGCARIISTGNMLPAVTCIFSIELFGVPEHGASDRVRWAYYCMHIVSIFPFSSIVFQFIHKDSQKGEHVGLCMATPQAWHTYVIFRTRHHRAPNDKSVKR